MTFNKSVISVTFIKCKGSNFYQQIARPFHKNVISDNFMKRKLKKKSALSDRSAKSDRSDRSDRSDGSDSLTRRLYQSFAGIVEIGDA